jgi:hypothetical protein
MGEEVNEEDFRYRPPENLREWLIHKFWLWRIKRTIRHNTRIAQKQAQAREIFERFWKDGTHVSDDK